MWVLNLLEEVDTAVPNHAAYLYTLLLLFATDVNSENSRTLLARQNIKTSNMV
jgi:hypothetical protein